MCPDSTTDREIRILFLGGAKRVSIARKFIDAGTRLGRKVSIFSYELSREVPIASLGQVIIGRRWSDPDLLADLHSHIKRLGIDIILPFVDPAIEVAGRYARTYNDAWAPTVSPDLAETLFDKAAAAQLYVSHRIPVPGTFTPDTPQFPLIAKPRRGSASKGITIINNSDELERLTAPDQYLIEKYIARREEYTVDAYITRSGSIICVSPRLRVEVLGGEVTRSVTVDDPALTRLATSIITSLRLIGPVTLQFIRDLTDSTLMLMEINPRLGGGVVCSVHAGADIPRYILEEYLGITSQPLITVKPGIMICRYFDETVFNV
ncbi:MAG: ATP-grasp domain-containing protein [Duncaniella sp.]|nr:ATP-grasp domain-containing protein [Duncaniella sp.]